MTRDWFEKEKEVPSIQDGESAKAQSRLQEEATIARVESTNPSTPRPETGTTGTAIDAGNAGRTPSELPGTRVGEPAVLVQPEGGTPGKVAEPAVIREPGGTAITRPGENPVTGGTAIARPEGPAVTGDASKVPGGQPGTVTGDAPVVAQPPKTGTGSPVAEVATSFLGTAVQRVEGAAIHRLEAATGHRGDGHGNPRGEAPRVEVAVNPRAETPVTVRMEGQVAVPRVVGDAIDVARGMRPPEDLARDRRAAETTFRSSETLEARVAAGTMLDTLRREIRTMEQRDPAYGTRVQEVYRAMLEGRGVIDGGRGQQQVERLPVPGRPGDSGVGDRVEIRRPNEGGPPSHERGGLSVDLSRLAGINFGDGRTREAFVDILRRVDAGTFRAEQLDPNGRRVFDAIKGFDPTRLEQIKQFFTSDAQGPGRQRVDDATIVRRVQEILEGGKDALGQRRTSDAGDGATTIGRSATERLVDFVRLNRDVLTQPLDSQASKAAIVELGKIVRDINKELGLDPTKGVITLKEVLARSLDATAKPASLEGTVRPGEKALQERLPAVKEEVLVARLNPAQEAAFRAALERSPRPETAAMQTDRRLETARVEASTQVPQRTAQMEGRPGEGRPIDARVAEDAGRQGSRAEQLGLRPELGVKAELAGKPEPAARDFGGKPDAGPQRPVDTTFGAVPSRSGDTAGQQPDQARLPGRSDLTDKPFEDEKKTKKAEEAEKDREQEQKAADAALAALMAARKAKEDKERAEKEKEKAQEKDKKDPERRQKYVVKHGDTLQSIAGKMLRDTRLAALILDINKNTIPIRQENGKTVADLRPATLIWLPTTAEIRDFRGRLMTAPVAPASASEQSSVPHAWGKELTPEEELAAKFGGNAKDYKAEPPEAAREGSAGGESAPSTGNSVEEMTLAASEAAKTRRSNVEDMLGPLSKPKPEGGRLSYTVRLGNTLKSIAINHPALQDVRLWKLLAEVNDLSTETDAKDIPAVSLKRGSALLIPSPQEIALYRARKVE